MEQDLRKEAESFAGNRINNCQQQDKSHPRKIGAGKGRYELQTIISRNLNGEIKVKNLEQGVEFEIILSLL